MVQQNEKKKQGRRERGRVERVSQVKKGKIFSVMFNVTCYCYLVAVVAVVVVVVTVAFSTDASPGR